jgi:hypothetical protein
LYYEIIKIETPEASVSGVFNLYGLFAGHCANHESDDRSAAAPSGADAGRPHTVTLDAENP